MGMRTLVFFLCFFPSFSFAAEDLAWKALLHFDGSSSSISSSSSFFLSPEGHHDAEMEARATLEYLKQPEGPCRFPARAIHFGMKPEGSGPLCDRWYRWREAVKARGIELVFAAAFLNSPSSMYGHTLLKFPRGGKTEGEELLDYTLSFGANTGNAGGLRYVWKGLTGGFPGFFSTAPFYLKVREYNHVENRDFWIYPLNVNEQELEILVAHAWELREIPFPYFFLRKNCAYYLLEFLEVARPGQGLVKKFPLWAVPMDTIRRLQSNGWLGEGRIRPSRQKILNLRKQEMSKEEQKLVRELSRGEYYPLPLGRQSLLLDTAYDLWRYDNEGKAGNSTGSELLRLRALAAGASKPLVIQELSPDKGHPTGRISVGGGASSQGALLELAIRPTLHDLLSPALGYEPHSELQMGELRFRFQKKSFFLEQFDLLRLRSLSPYGYWFPRIAWSFRMGTARAREMACEGWRCTKGNLSGGGGISASWNRVLFFSLVELDAEVGGIFEKNFRFSSGPSGGILAPLWFGSRMLLEGDYRFRLAGEKRQRKSLKIGIQQDWGRSWELRAEGFFESGGRYREALLKMNYYL